MGNRRTDQKQAALDAHGRNRELTAKQLAPLQEAFLNLLGDLLARIDRGGQADLAERLGVTEMQISAWKSGKLSPVTLEHYLSICNEAGIDFPTFCASALSDMSAADRKAAAIRIGRSIGLSEKVLRDADMGEWESESIWRNLYELLVAQKGIDAPVLQVPAKTSQEPKEQ